MSSKLVAYFSASGVTAKLADAIGKRFPSGASAAEPAKWASAWA